MGVNQTYDNPHEVVTTDGAMQTILDAEFPDGNTIDVDFCVLARSTTGVSASWSIRGLVKRAGGGAQLVDNFVQVFPARKDAGAALWDTDFIVQDNSVLIRIKGGIGTEIGWRVEGNMFGMRYPPL